MKTKYKKPTALNGHLIIKDCSLAETDDPLPPPPPYNHNPCILNLKLCNGRGLFCFNIGVCFINLHYSLIVQRQNLQCVDFFWTSYYIKWNRLSFLEERGRSICDVDFRYMWFLYVIVSNEFPCLPILQTLLSSPVIKCQKIIEPYLSFLGITRHFGKFPAKTLLP